MGDCCQLFEDFLFEPEEDLSKTDSARLAKHIEVCEQCRAERELFLESWTALEGFEPDLEPCPGVRAKVWEQIRGEENKPTPLFKPDVVAAARLHVQRFMVAGLALALGFGLGRGLRPAEAPVEVAAESTTSAATTADFLDPALIELASQEGFSVEIFPESTNFSPLDQEMRSALAPTDEERVWLKRDQGAVVPVRYISQNGVTP